MNTDRIEYATFIDAPCERVYRHFTTGKGLDAWFTKGAEVDARPGGKIRFRWVNFGARRESFDDSGEVLEAVEGKKFVFTWCPGDTTTTVAVSFSPAGQGCIVELNESGYSDSDADRRMMLYCACGWGEALTLLKFYLEHGVTYGEVP